MQCDLDVVGTTSLTAEAEVCGAVSQCYERLGFDDFEIRVNHRALLRAIIETAGISVDRESDAIVAVDKLDKIGADGVQAELVEKGLTADVASALMNLVTTAKDLDAVRAAMADNEKGAAAVADIQRLLTLAADTPAASRLTFDPTLARGLGYYTGSIFEVRAPDLASSLGGGGRYDGLVGMFCGRDIPACGFSIGLDRLLFVMDQRGLFPEGLGAPEVLVATTEKGREDDLLRLSYAIRADGRRVEMHPKPDKAGKLRKAANERGIDALVLIRRESDVVNVWLRADPEVADRMVPVTDVLSALR